MNYLNFTPIGYILFFFTVGLFLIGLNVSSTPVLLIASFISGMFIINFLELLIQPFFLVINVKLPRLIMEGSYDYVNIYVENRSKIPKGQIYIYLEEKLPIGGIRGKEKKEVAIYYNFKKRGIFRLDKLNVRFTGYLGLLYFHKRYKLSSLSYVYPLFYPLPQDIFLIDTEGNKSSTSVPSLHGEEFHSLRDYQPQDPLKIVAWKPSAKKGKLLSKNFEKFKKSSLKILIDNVIEDIDSIMEEEFDQLLRFIHSLIISSFSLNVSILIDELIEKKRFSPKTIEELREYLASIEISKIKDKSYIYVYEDYDIIFTLDYGYWVKRMGNNNKIILIDFHEKVLRNSKIFIYTRKDDPQEFLNKFLVTIQG